MHQSENRNCIGVVVSTIITLQDTAGRKIESIEESKLEMNSSFDPEPTFWFDVITTNINIL